jgi:hypothetical protein
LAPVAVNAATAGVYFDFQDMNFTSKKAQLVATSHSKKTNSASIQNQQVSLVLMENLNSSQNYRLMEKHHSAKMYCMLHV